MQQEELAPSQLWAAEPPRAVAAAELKMLLAVALQHDLCDEKPYIDGDAVVIPFWEAPRDGPYQIAYERVRTRQQLLDALGY